MWTSTLTPMEWARVFIPEGFASLGFSAQGFTALREGQRGEGLLYSEELVSDPGPFWRDRRGRRASSRSSVDSDEAEGFFLQNGVGAGKEVRAPRARVPRWSKRRW